MYYINLFYNFGRIDICRKFIISFNDIKIAAEFMEALEKKFLNDLKINDSTQGILGNMQMYKINKDLIIPNFESIDDALNLCDKILTNYLPEYIINNNVTIVESGYFDDLLSKILERESNKEEENNFYETIQSALNIIEYDNVNELDNESYDILKKALKLCTNKLKIEFLKDYI